MEALKTFGDNWVAIELTDGRRIIGHATGSDDEHTTLTKPAWLTGTDPVEIGGMFLIENCNIHSIHYLPLDSEEENDETAPDS